ncbi:MAG: hypothetical protein Q9184_004893 [Pyrenodesmia sp. 2 TL-2023]
MLTVVKRQDPTHTTNHSGDSQDSPDHDTAFDGSDASSMKDTAQDWVGSNAWREVNGDAANLNIQQRPRGQPSTKETQQVHAAAGQPGPAAYTQPPKQAEAGNPSLMSDIGTQTLESAGSENQHQATSSSSRTNAHPVEKTFHMVIHLPGNGSATRVAELDTGSGADLIGHDVVESLHLRKEKYCGDPLSPLGSGSFMPEWQVTLDWYIPKFRSKTYTTTCAVMDEKYSEFDVLLGLSTIKKVGFWKKNTDVWVLRTGDGQDIPV